MCAASIRLYYILCSKTYSTCSGFPLVRWVPAFVKLPYRFLLKVHVQVNIGSHWWWHAGMVPSANMPQCWESCRTPYSVPRGQWVNSLVPGKSEWSFRWLIFMWMLVITGWGISSEISLRWMSLDFPGDKSTLVQVMAWCRQATSHYLSQCWPRLVSTYVMAKPQWVNVKLQIHANIMNILWQY